MNNKLTLKQDSKLALNKSQNLISITNKILNDKLDLLDDSWIQKLWNWADEFNIDDLFMNDEYMDIGLPREKKKLLSLETLSLENYNITYIPKELFNLNKLMYLNLSNNKISKIPTSIKNL